MFITMALYKFLDPKNDTAFRRIFGTEQNKPILTHFLNDVLHLGVKDSVKDIQFMDTTQHPEIAGRKKSYVDILCQDVRGTQYIVEMQVAKYAAFAKRAQYYIAKAYSSQVPEAGLYQDLKKVILVGILNEKIFPDVVPYRSKHIFIETVSKLNLLRDLEIQFIELPKILKTKEEMPENIEQKWIYFFKYAHMTKEEDLDKIAGKDWIIKRAYQELNRFNWSLKEYRDYEQDLKRIRDRRAALDGIAEEIAMKLLKDGLDISYVAEATRLSIDYVKQLQEEIQQDQPKV